MLAWGRRGSGLGEAAAHPGESSRRAYGVVCLCRSVSTCILSCLSTWEPFWGPEGGGPEPLLYILLQLLPRRSKLLPIFPGGRSHFSLNFWASLDPEVTVHQISAELCPFEFFLIFIFFFFCFQLTPLTVYIWSTELYRSQFMG